MKQKQETELALEIDFELFTTEEIVRIFNFYSLISRKHSSKKHSNKEEVLKSYNEYKNTINNLSLQKKYDKNFEKTTGISIYQIIKDLGGKY